MRCPTCKKDKLFLKKWRYNTPNTPYRSVTSDIAVCWDCHNDTKALVLGHWSIRHYITFAAKFLGMVRKQGVLKTPLKNELDPQIPPTFLGWITKLYITIIYTIIKYT